MENNNKVLERVFSDLGVLQVPRRILYSYAAKDDINNSYFISVEEYQKQILCGQEKVVISAEGTRVEQVLLLLHENAVFPGMVRDVLFDLRGQGLIAMEG